MKPSKPFSGMSLKSTSGTSLVEVMVMMVILGISITGIYTMVDKGKELAMLTDTRLSAINIAREGLESVTTLRDTFALKGYEPGNCGSPLGVDAFFSTDEQIILDTNCPEVGTLDNNPYILQDDKKLKGGSIATPTNFDVCINEFGWYSQEFSSKNGHTLSICRGNPGNPNNCVLCSDTASYCETNTTASCKTQFQRKITFTSCDGYDTDYCIHVYSKVWWGASPDDASTSLVLDQIITTLD